jgi:hypothetical protein
MKDLILTLLLAVSMPIAAQADEAEAQMSAEITAHVDSALKEEVEAKSANGKTEMGRIMNAKGAVFAECGVESSMNVIPEQENSCTYLR